MELDVRWNHGVPSRRHAPEAPIQTHRYDEHTVILRQSRSSHYEAPFLYLLFGEERALLLDTGATADPTAFPLRDTVDGLIAGWLARYPRRSYELVVAHSHGHNDHVAADGQFADRPYTTVLPAGLDAVRAAFGFGFGWPDREVTLDLGDRVLSVLGSPGHHEAAITLFDPRTGWLLTGDTVYPGRLYVTDYPAFQDTLDRLVAFAGNHKVTGVLGCHVEMTDRPRRDYPVGARYQPRERALPLSTDQLTAIRDAAASVRGRPGVHRFDDAIIWYRPGRAAVLAMRARAALGRLR